MSHPESIGQKLPGFPKLKKKIRKRKVHFGRGVNWESVKEEEVGFDVNIEKKMEELERQRKSYKGFNEEDKGFHELSVGDKCKYEELGIK